MNFKSERGSAAAIALIMVSLFLAGGLAWSTMMATENTVSAGEWQKQEAVYAAQAGMEHVKVALKSDDATIRTWLNTNNADKTTSAMSAKKINLDTINGDNVQYSFAIVNKANGKKITNLTVADTTITYAVSVMGYVGDKATYILEEVIFSWLENMRNWGKEQNISHSINNSYWGKVYPLVSATGQFDYATNPDGLIVKLDESGIRKFVGDSLNLNGQRRWQAAENTGYLFIRPAGAVMMDGTVGDIQMLVANPTDGNNLGAFAAAAFVVAGKTYYWTDTSNRLAIGGTGFGNNSATIMTNSGTPVRLTSAAAFIQYFARSDVTNNWSSVAEQITWAQQTLLTAGYKEAPTSN